MDWEKIRAEYESTSTTLIALADKHQVKDSTLRSRKNREQWQRNGATQRKKSAATKKRKNVAPKKPVGGQIGNRGNPSPKKKFTKRNSAAVTHGLFSRYLPQETLDILEQTENITPVDILWMNIKMQFASIMRAQQIMHVKSREDSTRVLKKEKPGMYGDEQEWEIQFAWDKQASFLNSQSRAMGELRSMLKQFDEMASADDERRLKLEQMSLTVEKTKVEIEKIVEDDSDKPIEIMIKRKS